MARVLGPAGRVAQGLLRLSHDGGVGRQCREARPLLARETHDLHLEDAEGLLGEPVDHVARQDGVEHAAADAARVGAACAQCRDHERDRQTGDADREDVGGQAAVGHGEAHLLGDALLPVARDPLGAGPEVARCAVEARTRGHERVARRDGRPLRDDRRGGGLGVVDEQHREVVLDRGGDVVGLGTLAGDAVDESLADAPDLALDRPEHLARADEVLPAHRHVTAHEAAIGQGRTHGALGLGEAAVDRGPELVGSADLRVEGVGQVVAAQDVVAHRSVEGRAHDEGAGLVVAGEVVQPVDDRFDGVGREQAVGVDGRLGDREQRGVRQTARGHHAGQVAPDLDDAVAGGAVEHHRDRGAAFGRLAQVVPGDLVGVAGGGRDEEPEVRGREELGRELPVALVDRVDVRGVEDRQSLGHLGAGAQPEPVGRVARDVGAGEVRQDAVGLEPGTVVGVVREDRRAGRGPQHAGLGDDLADDGVDQRGLARTGGAAHHHEHRRVELHEAGQDVVGELVGDCGLQPAGTFGVLGGERELGVADAVQERAERAEELARGVYADHDHSSHVSRVTRFVESLVDDGPTARGRPPQDHGTGGTA